MKSKFCKTTQDFRCIDFPVLTEAPKLPREDWEIINKHGWVAWSRYKSSLIERKVDKRKYRKIESFFYKNEETVSVWEHKLTGLYRVYDEKQKRWITDLSEVKIHKKLTKIIQRA